MKKSKKLLTGLTAAALIVLFFLISVPAFAAGIGTVNCSGYLNVREAPSTGAKILDKIYQYAKVTIFDSLNGWYKINYDGKTGWVSSTYISIENSASSQGIESGSGSGVNTSTGSSTPTDVHDAINSDNTLNRIQGIDRYATAVEISKSGWSNSQYAVLATGEDFPDALCATPLAKKLNAPILLTEKSVLDTGALGELKRLGVQKVYIIGGTGVLSLSIENTLKSNNISSQRISGSDRYQTSIEVAKFIADNFGTGIEAVIATGDDFPDALSIAPVAAQKGMPILLTTKKVLPDALKLYITEKGITTTYIVGGPGVISMEALKDLPNPTRLYGNTRYETNAAILNKFANDMDFSTAYLATGEDFPDALAGSALAASRKSPIILLDQLSGQAAKDFVAGHRSQIKKLDVLGGEKVVPYGSVERLLPRIVSLNNITQSINQGDSYKLPATVEARLDDNTTESVPVTWDTSSFDPDSTLVFKTTGSVKGYDGQVSLNLVIKHNIMGKSRVTAEQMADFLLKYSPNPKISSTPLELAQYYIQEGDIEGVRGDIVFCQSIIETGWFKYGGLVLPEQNNYGGMGAASGSGVGNGAWFDTPREGVRGLIQHLKAYASKEPLHQPTLDTKYDVFARNNMLGIAPTWEDLAGRWAVPGYDSSVYSSLQDAMAAGESYGQEIFQLYEKLKAFEN